jgi:hypothetical protein
MATLMALKLKSSEIVSSPFGQSGDSGILLGLLPLFTGGLWVQVKLHTKYRNISLIFGTHLVSSKASLMFLRGRNVSSHFVYCFIEVFCWAIWVNCKSSFGDSLNDDNGTHSIYGIGSYVTFSVLFAANKSLFVFGGFLSSYFFYWRWFFYSLKLFIQSNDFGNVGNFYRACCHEIICLQSCIYIYFYFVFCPRIIFHLLSTLG